MCKKEELNRVYWVLRKGNLYFNTYRACFYSSKGIAPEEARFEDSYHFLELSRITDFKNSHTNLKSWDMVKVEEHVSVNRKFILVKDTDETQAHS